MAIGFLVMGSFAVQAQDAVMTAEITFEKEVHDYGDLKQGANGDYEFKFTNTGSSPLILSDVHGSCSCTTPKWPKTPIMPGESASIQVHYDTKRVGPINKTVTITANIEGGTKILRIKGNVLAAETSNGPVNQQVGPVNTH